MIRKIIGFIYGKFRQAYYEERYKYFRKKYNIVSNFGFNGVDISIYGEGELKLGNDSYIGNYSSLQLAKGFKIEIGNNCQISHNVRMYTSSLDPDQDFTIPKKKAPKNGNILIGDGVWIGANVFINPGIKIGDNAVIGANSVLTKDVLPGTIVGGVPARLIRHKTTVK